MLNQIYQKIQLKKKRLEDYLTAEFLKTPPLPYLSCDLRNSGHKIAVIDTNLFPAGFNNLCKSFTEKAVAAFKRYFEKFPIHPEKILIFSEAHTRNKFYFENLLRLEEILKGAGFLVRIGIRSEEYTDPVTKILIDNEKSITLHKMQFDQNKIVCDDNWTPDLVLSNNDFSSKIDPLFEHCKTPILPNPNLGWHRRKKSSHFEKLGQIIIEISALLEIDPWFLSAITQLEKEIHFENQSSIERLAAQVEQTIEQIKEKYSTYKIDATPYVFIKNNSGTYGMGVASVFSGDEVLQMGRRARQKLSSSKGGALVTEYLVQEGIPTDDFYSGYPMEPVIYGVGDQNIGGFFRLNPERNAQVSLNAKGMSFSCLCLHKLDEPHEAPFLQCQEKRELVEIAGFLSRLAALAAARESSRAIFLENHPAAL